MSKKAKGREEAIRKTVKKRNKRRKKRLLLFFFAFMIIALAVLVVLSATVLFPVKNIVVEGKSSYTAEEVISASGIEDDNIIMLSSAKVKNRISKKLPLSGKITVKKRLPDTVTITVSAAVPTYYFVFEDIYYITDENFKVIRKDAVAPEGCKYLKISDFKAVKPGNKLKIPSEDKEKIDDILKRCEDMDFDVTAVDVSERLALKIILKNKILVLLGSDTDIDRKLLHLSASLPEMSENAQGTIDLRNWTSTNAKANFRDEKIDILGFCSQKPKK